MSKFTSILGKIGLAAAKSIPEVVATVYPPLGGLTGIISGLVLRAQADHGPGNNETKKEQVISELTMFVPFILPFLEQISGKDLDDAAFAKLMSDLVDINVQWHKLIGSIPTPNRPEAPAAPGIPGVGVSGPGIAPTTKP